MKLLLTGAWRDAQKHASLLSDMGHEIIFLQYEADPLPCDPREVEGVVCNSLFLHHDIRLFEKLRYIRLTSAGFDRVDTDYIASRGIELYNARGVYSIPMAEHAVAAVLNLYRHFASFVRRQEVRCWQKDRSLSELYGKTVCILGCGSVGTECAKRFAAFGCRVVGLDLVTQPKPSFETIYPISETEKAIAAADVVILTLPLTEQTEGMVDKAFLDTLKDGCVLVNIARGKLVDSAALIEELKKRRISAALDVFDEEPLPSDSPLWGMENVLITPHNSFVSDAVGDRLSRLIIEGLK